MMQFSHNLNNRNVPRGQEGWVADAGGIAGLFAGGYQGVYLDTGALFSKGWLFQDRFWTTPVTATGQPVGSGYDMRGPGENNWSAPSDAARPALQFAGGYYYLAFDAVDDTVTFANSAFLINSSIVVGLRVRLAGTPTGNGVIMAGTTYENNKMFYVQTVFDPYLYFYYGSSTLLPDYTFNSPTNTFHNMVFRQTIGGGDLELRKSGIIKSTKPNIGPLTECGALRLMSYFGSRSAGACDIARVFIINRALTAPELAMIDAL